MKKLTVFLIVASFLFVTTASVNACFLGFGSDCVQAKDASQTEAQQTEENQNRLMRAVPLPRLNTSLERINIKKRLELFSDENKVSYIYLVSYGRVMAFYTVKGKITSGQKRLTRTEMLTDGDGNLAPIGEKNWLNNILDTSAMVTESPELDGTYGSSSPYIFFWTTDGTYVQWNGEYMLADQPLKLTTQPELVREIK